MQKIIIYGAGGHAKVIIDIVHKCHKYTIAGLIDDNPARRQKELLGEVIRGSFEDLPGLCKGISGFIIAVGDSHARYEVWQKLQSLGVSYVEAVHPSAIIGEEATIGEGSVVMAGAVVNCCARVGSHSIINTACSVDHDCDIGDFAQIAPGAVLCGRVRVGDLSLVAAGATVLPGIAIGRESIVGAGAVVTQDVPDRTCVVGVPARPLRKGT